MRQAAILSMNSRGLSKLKRQAFYAAARRWFCVSVLLLALTCVGASAARTAVPVSRGEIEYLWPTGAPGAVGSEEQDRPHLEIFRAAGAGAHTAVIVCPGGAYVHLAYEKEGTRIAEWLNARGVTAFVLTYRLAPRYKYPAPINDGKRAVRWVRAHAAEYDVAPERIGMWGSSAGGHLVGMVATHFDAGNVQSADPVERVSDRPDFVVSAYGLMNIDAEIAKHESMTQFTNAPITPEVLKEISPSRNVTAQTPPTFLFATSNDARVPALTSVAFYVALVKVGVPAEIHIFEKGPHGTGLAKSYPALSAWTHLLETWMRQNGWIVGAAKPAAAHAL